MQRTCRQCATTFEISDDDVAFLAHIAPTFGSDRFPVPPPTLCPRCRAQHRMGFRNERHLHRRTCDLCLTPFLSIYRHGTPFPVYCYDCWWSDRWDPLSYGRAYDLSHSFFEQFEELANDVPHLGIVYAHCENCEYTNYTNYSKDSYLVFGCHAAEECLYGWRVHSGRQCVDCLQIDKSQICYECVDCDGCYNLRFSQDSTNCSDSFFLYDCKGCTHCIGCAGLRNRQYCIWNKQLTKEEFERHAASLALHMRSGIEHMRETFIQFLTAQPRRAALHLQCEHVTGDSLIQCRNVHQSFHTKNAEDCRYLESCEDIKDARDCAFSGWPGELFYQCLSAGVHCQRQLFCATSWSTSNALYCDSCHHSSNLLGCFGLHAQNHHCILNKQYEPAEYDRLAARVVESMMGRDEYGEFFPPALSPFPYNHTVAADFFPLAREAATAQGWQWSEEDDETPATSRTISGDDLPDTIDAVTDDVLHYAVICIHTGRLFRIVKRELDFYRMMQLPLPKLHPDERHRLRWNQRNPSELRQSVCGDCGKEILTSYHPQRKLRILCDDCYRKEVY